jgi:hypothetical protein
LGRVAARSVGTDRRATAQVHPHYSDDQPDGTGQPFVSECRTLQTDMPVAHSAPMSLFPLRPVREAREIRALYFASAAKLRQINGVADVAYDLTVELRREGRRRQPPKIRHAALLYLAPGADREAVVEQASHILQGRLHVQVAHGAAESPDIAL